MQCLENVRIDCFLADCTEIQILQNLIDLWLDIVFVERILNVSIRTKISFFKIQESFNGNSS